MEFYPAVKKNEMFRETGGSGKYIKQGNPNSEGKKEKKTSCSLSDVDPIL